MVKDTVWCAFVLWCVENREQNREQGGKFVWIRFQIGVIISPQ